MQTNSEGRFRQQKAPQQSCRDELRRWIATIYFDFCRIIAVIDYNEKKTPEKRVDNSYEFSIEYRKISIN